MRRALLVGIDHYLGSPLTGCVADAEGMAAMLEQNQDASPNYDVKLVTSDPGPTKDSLRNNFPPPRLLRRLDATDKTGS